MFFINCSYSAVGYIRNEHTCRVRSKDNRCNFYQITFQSLFFSNVFVSIHASSQLKLPIDSTTIFPITFLPVESSSAVWECKHLIDSVAPPTPPVACGPELSLDNSFLSA